MTDKMKVNVTTEFGELEGVIIHTPGLEVEEMTPETAKRALYSDILNLAVATEEYKQLKGVLNKVSRVFEVTDLLAEVLKSEQVRKELLDEICRQENAQEIHADLFELTSPELARQLIQGVPIMRNNLTRYLSQERFSLWPLHNFLFTRDASMSFRDEVVIGKMANAVRDREALIMEAIFNHHPMIEATTVNSQKAGNIPTTGNISIEGGDFQVAREDVLVIGTGIRTSTQGIDFILESIKAKKEPIRHVLVQELPDMPESFIHLDMVFTFLDRDACMVYEPLILGTTRYHTIHIQIENGEVTKITEEKNLVKALKKLGIDLNPIYCGGRNDIWTQEREQWHSGANFFAIAPGQVIGYERNVNTVEELNKSGFEVIKAQNIIDGKAEIPKNKKCVITIAGSELARGGGGARCMTMPFKRKKVDW
ncbi:arginine deiminase [Mangrovibacterium diazotrophicum]|uniref:arginine deiminase n=1 Tax=Mangrovibacterium diazotrophicum TaxID=1261403 RepID=A0A419WBF7_9BACT|nr:arginine deiminase family protein [Mangrovibacterium diazotrophicum]RKD92764.1 arginine deiminase [Mangrovibacterium diazotrophicum]